MGVDVNDSSHWREFEKNIITHSAAHYLMAINHLHQEFGYARVTNIANVLEISRGAASMALAQLKKRGWVKEDANRFLLLTDQGKKMAVSVEKNFVILSQFFQDVLGIPTEVALADACKMEHLMSLETGQRMMKFMRLVLKDKIWTQKIKRALTHPDPSDENPAAGQKLKVQKEITLKRLKNLNIPHQH